MVAVADTRVGAVGTMFCGWRFRVLQSEILRHVLEALEVLVGRVVIVHGGMVMVMDGCVVDL